MKTSRVITLVLVAVTTLLCCLPASALDVANSYSYSNVIDNSLTQYLNVSVMYADDESYAYGTDSDVVQYYDAPTYQALVNYRVKNTSDQDANLNVSYIALDFGLQASGYNVIGVEYVSGALEPYYVSISDFRLQQVDGTSTTVIVPAGGYISGTFIIHLQETYDNSSGTHIEYPAFSNFNTWDSFSPTYGNYNSTVIDYVSDVYVEMLDQGMSLDDIYTALNNWDVDVTNFSTGQGYLAEKSNNHNQSGVQYLSRFLALQPVLHSQSVESTPNGNLYSYVFRVPISFFFSLTNITDEPLRCTSELVSLNQYCVLPTNCNYVGLDIHFTDNVLIDSFSYQSSAFRTKFYFTEYKGLLLQPGERWSGSLIAHVYLSVNSSTPISSFTPNFSFTDLTFPNLTFEVYTTDIEDVVSDQHEQEQTYYSDTNTALQNSGLPDYNFNSQQTGGLSGVSDDFVRVWNACGPLNSVFVFSLTLSLALYILRHRRRL